MVYPHRLVLVGMLPFRNEIHLLMEAQQCQFAVAYLGPFLAGGADDATGKMRYADSGIGRVHMLPPRTWRRTARHSSSTPCNSSFKHIAFVVFFLFVIAIVSSSMFFLLCRDRRRDAELRPCARGLAGGR